MASAAAAAVNRPMISFGFADLLFFFLYTLITRILYSLWLILGVIPLSATRWQNIILLDYS